MCCAVAPTNHFNTNQVVRRENNFILPPPAEMSRMVKKNDRSIRRVPNEWGKRMRIRRDILKMKGNLFKEL
jgi:hypothetical protein